MNIGDIFRKVTGYADELFIKGSGRIITHVNQKTQKRTELRGIYEIPIYKHDPFGIDSPDEMNVEFGYKTLLDKIGYLPKICDRPNPEEWFLDHRGNQWVLIGRQAKDNFYLGESRIVLTLQRYQESLTTSETRKTTDIQKNNSVV